MTLDDVAGALPNGLHDAMLHGIHIDYRTRQARLALDVCLGDPDGERERRGAAEIVLSGLVFAAIEPPAAGYPHGIAGPVRIDLTDVPEAAMRRLPPLPEGAFAGRPFVGAWNAFITLAARDAALHRRDGG